MASSQHFPGPHEKTDVIRSRDRDGHKDTTKTKTIRHVPMNPVAKAALSYLYDRRPDGHDFVFANQDGTPMDVQHVYRDFQLAAIKAGLKHKIRFHDLRHTFASHFMMNGGNAYDLQKILGHSKFEMTQIYAHLSADHLIEASKIVSFGSVGTKSSPPLVHLTNEADSEKVLMLAKSVK